MCGVTPEWAGPWKHLLSGRGRDKRQVVLNGKQAQSYEGRGWSLNETAYGPYKDPKGRSGRQDDRGS